MKQIIITVNAKLLEDPALKHLFTDLEKRHDIKVDTSTANSAVKALGDNISTAMAKFGLVKQGFDAALDIVKKIGAAIIDPAAEMEQFRLRLNALYGSVEDASKAFEKFRIVAAKTPGTLAEVVQAGANLKAFGLEAEDVLESVADLAAFMGIDVVDASQAVGRAFAGGAGAAIMLRDRGILELVKSFAKVDDLSKLTLPEFREALIGAMQDPAIGIAGASETLSNSYTGAMANMEDALYTLRAEIGGFFTPIITDATNALAGLIENLAGVGSNFQVVSKDAAQQKLQFDTLILTYTELHKKTERTKEENELYQKTINDLMRLYPNYFKDIDLEKGKWDDIKRAINGASQELENWLNLKVQEAIAQDYQEDVLKLQRQYQDAVLSKNQFEAQMKQEGKSKSSLYHVSTGMSGGAYAVASVSWGEVLAARQQKENDLLKKLNNKKKEMNEQIKLAQKLFAVTPTPPRDDDNSTGTGTGSGSGSGSRPSGIPSRDDVAAALAELRRLYADDREQVEIEFERRSQIIAIAYKKDSDQAKAAIQQLNEWKEDQLEEITLKEIAAEEKKQRELEYIRELEKRQLLADYDAEIQRLANLRHIGALSYEELTSSLRKYTEQIKETFGDQSDEYAHALEAMRLAQLRVSETLADQWRTQNAVFLDIWNATASSMAAGFDTAFNSILDKSLSASERMTAVWHSMRSSFISSISSMVAQFIQAKMTELAVTLTAEKGKQAAILQTLGVQKTSFVSSVAMAIKSAFAGLYEAIANVWQWWTKLLPPPFSIAAAIATGAGMIAGFKSIKKQLGFAEGGLIRGPGTSTSDDIPIMASDGEYIVNARAVAQPGILPLLQHINSLSPTLPFKSPAHFASGGLVQPYAINPTDLSQLIAEVKEMRSQLHHAIYDAQPTIINQAPNPIEVHKMAETGRKLYKGY